MYWVLICMLNLKEQHVIITILDHTYNDAGVNSILRLGSVTIWSVFVLEVKEEKGVYEGNGEESGIKVERKDYCAILNHQTFFFSICPSVKSVSPCPVSPTPSFLRQSFCL